MVGRRRRTSSNSTTGTLDYDKRAFAKELSVLKKHEPELDADEDTELLQTFVLEDATVCDKAGRLVELFTVNTGGPFIVRGRVVIDDAQKSRAVNPATRTALIETRDCTRYAIGVSSNAHGASNTYGAWAGGQAGWYEIRPPSAAYKAIYDHTIEGVSLYYTILSVIEEHVEAQNAKRGKKGKRKGGKLAVHEQLSIDALLFKYAVATGDGVTYDEAVSRCDDHAQFLISHFYEDTEFDWLPTVFFEWMTQRHQATHAKVLEVRSKRLKGVASKPPLSGGTEVGVPSIVYEELPATKTLSKRKQRNAPSESNGSIQRIDSHDHATTQRGTRAISRGKTKTQSPFTIEPQVEAMDVDDVSDATPPQTELVQVVHNRSNVDALLEGIEDIKPEVGPLNAVAFSKVSSKIYYKYKIRVYLGASDILRYYAKELVERLDENEWGGSGFWSTLQEAAQSPRITLEHVKLEQIPDSLVRRKALTTAGPRNRNQALSNHDEAQKAAAIATPPPRRVGRPAGKMSGLRLAGTGGKRRFDTSDESPESVSRKAARRSHAFNSDEDDVMNEASNSDEEGSSSDPMDSSAAVKVVVRAENIPTTIPKGPHGTWVCDEDDCGFVERNPESEEGRERIHEHMQDVHYHKVEEQVERISLAVAEGGRNHLPIEYSSPSPSPDFRYHFYSGVQGEVSPFWESDPSGPTTDRTALSSQAASDAGLEHDGKILHGTFDSFLYLGDESF